MKIIRQKKFAAVEEPQQLTPRDIQLENMRMQRQIMINQRTKQKIEADAAKARMKQIQQLQKMEMQKDMHEDKARIQTQKMQNLEDTPKNVGLYKTRSKGVEPVAMPK